MGKGKRGEELAPLDFGTVQIYTGDGKGKTTAALGAALRAAGHGLSVLVIQFMKGSPDYGELRIASHIPGLTIVPSGLPTFVERGNPGPEDVRLAREGLARARRAMEEGEVDLLVLDEINCTVDYGVLPLDDVLDLLARRPPRMELILTGRRAHPRLLEQADTVSEVQEVKHHYRRGMVARQGIEY
jgi:cob(I)alamin adenosyltransferase